MSVWTHVSGYIRIDGLNFLDGVEEKVRTAFGNTCAWESSKEEWDACNVPCGSEGSVQYAINRSGYGDDSLCWGGIAIWGDLRDYENAEPIYEWIKKACSKLYIRQCSVLVETEFRKRYAIYSNWNDEDNSMEILIKELE